MGISLDKKRMQQVEIGQPAKVPNEPKRNESEGDFWIKPLSSYNNMDNKMGRPCPCDCKPPRVCVCPCENPQPTPCQHPVPCPQPCGPCSPSSD